MFNIHFFNPIYDGLHDFNFIYELVIHDNLWINEPFHSKFYEFCMIINDNDFMIIDPSSKSHHYECKG